MTASKTLTSIDTAPRYRPPPSPVGPVLVATDASPASTPALVAARLLLRTSGGGVRVLSVLDGALAPATERGLHVERERRDGTRKAARLAAVREQVRRIAGEDAAWTVEVRLGNPARVVARVAAECGARLVVVGLRPHGLPERLLHAETALQLVRLVRVPVLAVPTHLAELPERALVAVDFSPCSVRAARAAPAVLQERATVHLAHVVPPDGTLLPGWAPWDEADDRRVRSALEQLGAGLGVAPGTVVKPAVLHGGDPARAVLDFADTVRAGLVAVGSRGGSLLERLMIGSVTTRLVRAARHPVLIVPPPEGERA